jgi:uncharacterized SAM-dependent methyltransferase
VPEYYLTRAEHEILVTRAGAIAARFDEPTSLAELGSGSARKTRLLIEAFLSRHGALRYVPIDISRSAWRKRRRCSVTTAAAIRAIAATSRPAALRADADAPRVILWLGSTSVTSTAPRPRVS